MHASVDFIKQLELEYLRILSKEIRSGTISAEVAQASARYFLKLLPFSSYNDITIKIEKFATEYTQFTHLFTFVKQQEQEVKTQIVLERMRKLMKENKITEAIAAAQTT